MNSDPNQAPSKAVHLKTMFWLRWRLLVNQFARLGRANQIATIVVLALAFLGSVCCFFVGWLGSSFLFEKIYPEMLMLVWTVLGIAFLFAWGIGVLTDLQRSEPLALDKFLHLPVSPRGAFVSNFLSSFLSITMFLMFPILFGICLGMIRNLGWHMLPSIALFLSFVFMVLAATYQLKGWLAALMVNPKRRRLIITCFTMFFVLLTQVPNLLNMTVFEKQRNESKQLRRDQKAKVLSWKEMKRVGDISKNQFDQKMGEQEAENKQRFRESVSEYAGWTRWGNRVLPPGWLAIGMEELANKRFLWPFVFLLGMTGLGTLSLRAAYRSTLRMYRGELNKGQSNESSGALSRTGTGKESTPTENKRLPRLSSLFEKKIGLLSDSQSNVFAAAFAGIMRAPEVKLALLSPILIMVLMGASLAFRDASAMPEVFRSLTGVGVGGFALLGVLQIMNNQFGFDRSGFRILMLSPVSRRDVLIGKNAALAVPTILLGFVGVCFAQFFIPMKPTHFVAAFFQMGTMYLVVCMIGNWISIHCPIGVAAGSMKPVNLKLGVLVLQILAAMALPIASLPLMSFPFIEYLLIEWMGWPPLPIYLVLSIAAFALMLLLYFGVVKKQGKLLRQKEIDILAVIGNPVG